MRKGFTRLIDKSHYRSRHRRCSVRKSVLSNFPKFTGKRLCQSLFFNKDAGFSPWKERLWNRCFHVKIVNFFTEPFLQNTYGRLLLSLWEDKTFHYKVPYSLRFISLKKILQWVKSRKKIFNAFYVQLLFWKMFTS